LTASLRPGDRVGDGEVWACGPQAGTVWVSVPDLDVAGVVHGDGTRAVLTAGEQRARITRAGLITEVGAVVADDRDGQDGMFGYQRRGVVHIPGCRSAADGDVLQRADAARAALADDVDRLVGVMPVRGRYRGLRWCPDCLGGSR
jgi:hypothetical protein